MADLTFLTTFFVDWQARGIIGDTYDPGFNPDAFKPWCDIQFTPKLIGQDSQEIPIVEQDPKLTLLLLPVRARLESGVLKAVRGPAPATGEDTPTADEYNEQRDSVGVPLIAETPALELPDGVHLIYQVKFAPMKIDGGTYEFDDFTFAAATTATRIDLTTVDRIDLPPSSRTELTLRMVPDDVTLVGPSTIQFWSNGIALGQPIEIDTSTAGPSSTDVVPEGAVNRYFTDARADARIAAAQLVAKALTSTAGFGFVDNDPTLAGNSATKLVTQQAIRAFVTAKFAEFVGVAPAELDTWIEMVAAVQADQGAIAGLTSLISTKATPADIAAAISALIGDATSAGNTLKKLEDEITALSASVGGAPPMKIDSTTHAWPARPSVSFPIFWIGGDAPVDRPPGMLSYDVWFPTTGDDIDLGVVLEALQGITAAANTVPFFDAVNHAASLAFKTAFSSTPSHTTIVSEKTVKDYIDKMPVRTATASDNVVGTDKGTMVQYSSTASGTFTVTNDFVAGNVVSFRQTGTGTLTIAAGSGLTKDGAGGKFRLAGQFCECSIHFDTDTHFYVTGDLIV